MSKLVEYPRIVRSDHEVIGRITCCITVRSKQPFRQQIPVVLVNTTNSNSVRLPNRHLELVGKHDAFSHTIQTGSLFCLFDTDYQ